MLAIALLLPVTTADWSHWSSTEPDTPFDTPSLMWSDPPTASQKHRIYFGVVSLLDDADINPNVALLDLDFATRVESGANEHHEAMLGVWVDCNGDGYVGHGLGAVREYRNELLTERSRCPPVTGSPNSWTTGAHNYNNWVTELIPIAGKIRDEADYQRDKRVYRDNEAMVWGDHGRPGEPPRFRACPLNPQPRGTYQSTGGFINFFDCRVDLVGAANVVIGATGDPLGLKFANEDDARSGQLGRINTFGSEDSSHSPARVQDCSAPVIVRSGDVLNETGLGPATAGAAHDFEIRPPPANPISNTQDPTLPGFYNETTESIRGDCDTSNDRGADFYGGLLGEDDVVQVNPNDKRRASWNFRFVISNRGGFPVSLVPGSGGNAGANENDAGLYIGGSRWTADSTWLTKTGPRTVRAELSGVEIDEPWWLTFYAHVGEASRGRQLVTPSTTPQIYGIEFCGSHDSGIRSGWNCNPALWYINEDGSPIPAEFSPLARPGAPYELRDVDCYDGDMSGVIAVGPPAYGNHPCP